MINMKKRVFVYRIDGKFCPCPFVGITVESPEDFIEKCVKPYYSKETGYPGLYYSTKRKDVNLVFSGHQYECGESGKWTWFKEGSPKSDNWFSITKDNSWYEMLQDDAVVQKKIDAITALVNRDGGITIKVG